MTKLVIRWLAALAALFLLGAVLAEEPVAANRIAFITLQGQLATIDPDGSDLQVLSSGQQVLQFPAWSPDGSSLAVIGNDANGGTVQLYSFMAGAEAPVVRELYRSQDQAPFYLYWSPDSQVVSFLANNPTNGIALYLAPRDGESHVLTTGSPFYWQWAADSQHLLIHSGFAGAGSRLGFTDAVKDTLDANLADPGFFQSPGISPSGRYIAFGEAGSAGNGQVILRNNPGVAGVGGIEREVRHQGLAAMSWSPTQDLLAIMSPPRPARTFTGQIDLLDAETGLLEPLVSDIALAFFWSPDGRFIAYLTPVTGGGGEVASLPSGLAFASTGGLVQRAPLLLELHLADVKTRKTSLLATFAPSLLFVQQFLPFFDQYALSHRLWSPSSDALVLPMLDDQLRPQVTVVSLDGTLNPIAEGETPFWNQR